MVQTAPLSQEVFLVSLLITSLYNIEIVFVHQMLQLYCTSYLLPYCSDIGT